MTDEEIRAEVRNQAANRVGHAVIAHMEKWRALDPNNKRVPENCGELMGVIGKALLPR